MEELKLISAVAACFVILICLMISLNILNSPTSLRGGSFLFLHVNYILIFSTFVGVCLAAFDVFPMERISSIEQSVKLSVLVSVSFAIAVILSTYCLISFLSFKITFFSGGFLTNKEMGVFYYSNSNRVVRFLKYSVFILATYTLVKYILFFKDSPFYLILSGDVTNAAIARMEVQTGIKRLDLPYISKYIEISCYFTTVLSYIINKLSKKLVCALLFYASLVFSFLYLFFEVEKSPFIYLLLMLGLVKVYLEGFNIKIIFYMALFLSFLLSMYFVVMGGNGDAFSILWRILDRVVIGQNQAMYYMYQHFEPTFQGVFSDFYFSESLGLNEVKPDERVLPYIYSDTTHLINANTFFLGEAWSYFGLSGLLFMPFFVCLSLFFYVAFFSFISFRNRIFWPLGLVFFTMLPINQSLQYIIYQKFFLYFILFGLVPIVAVWKCSKYKIIL